MFVAKCCSCKNKTILQACEVCEEAKCKICAQQHLAEYHAVLKCKWQTLESRFQSVKERTETRRDILADLGKKTHEQLTRLAEDYQKELLQLNQQYHKSRQEMNLSKDQYDNERKQLENQWKELEANELYRQWTSTNDSSRYLLQGDTSSIEGILTEIESSFSNKNNCNLPESAFTSEENISLGKVNCHQPIIDNSTHIMRKLYYAQMTSTPRYAFTISILPRFMSVYQSFIYVCDPHGNIEKYEYLPPENLNLLQTFHLENDKHLYPLTCFALTANYIITYTKNRDYIKIYNHQGILKNTIAFRYQPKYILSTFDSEDFWICSDIKKVCISFHLDTDYNLKQLEFFQYDDVQPVRLFRKQNQLFIHDSRASNGKTRGANQDNLLMYDSLNLRKKQPVSISLDFIKSESYVTKSPLYHPIMDFDGFLIIKHVPYCANNLHDELVVIDANVLEKLVIVNRIKLESVFGMAFTADNKLIVGVGGHGKDYQILIF